MIHETLVLLPKGYRMLSYGEFVPLCALYLSTDGTWRRTPSVGKAHNILDGIVYIVPAGVGIFANPLPPGE
jgi:hypothetical protein